MRYIIRDARPSDSEAINRLSVEAYEEFRPTLGETNWRRLRETLSHSADLSSEGKLIVAEDETGVLGIVLYLPPGRADEASLPARTAMFRTLAVSPISRGRGIGRALTEECIDRARRDDAEAIALTSAEMMTVALPMYVRMGFRKETDLGHRFGVKHSRYVLPLK